MASGVNPANPNDSHSLTRTVSQSLNRSISQSVDQSLQDDQVWHILVVFERFEESMRNIEYFMFNQTQPQGTKWKRSRGFIGITLQHWKKMADTN